MLVMSTERSVIRLEVQQLDAGIALPAYSYSGDAGLDLRARLDVTVSAATGAQTVPTGLAVAIPPGFVGLICPRSGLAAQHGVSVLNAPGVIDAGYRGELAVVLFSTRALEYVIRRGDRIAQLLVQPVTECDVVQVASLGSTSRGAAGFGSTG
jgi:dUTP pyrophosphatase